MMRPITPICIWAFACSGGQGHGANENTFFSMGPVVLKWAFTNNVMHQVILDTKKIPFQLKQQSTNNRQCQYNPTVNNQELMQSLYESNILSCQTVLSGQIHVYGVKHFLLLAGGHSNYWVAATRSVWPPIMAPRHGNGDKRRLSGVRLRSCRDSEVTK